MNQPLVSLPRGFTLIELLAALLILSLVGLMSYRGLDAVINAHKHVGQETEKWRRVSAFFLRFERDVQLAAPRPVRNSSGTKPAWVGKPDATAAPLLEFSRFTSAGGLSSPGRLAYRLNENQDIELWLWPGLDVPPDTPPARYAVLSGVRAFDLQYLNDQLAWVDAWPVSPSDVPIPRAVRLRIVLASGEEIVRVFSLMS